MAMVTATTAHHGDWRSTCSSQTSTLRKGCDIASSVSA
ncbi:Uncharacterised protein [Bordetella pertussis]|nr:Uncharacterised protein [Bordetella pertussis]